MGSGGGHDLLDVETRQLLVHCPAVHSIAIMDEVTRGIPIGNRLNQLLSNPFRCGVLGDVEVQNFSPPVSENHEDEQYLETKRRHGKEIDRHDFTSRGCLGTFSSSGMAGAERSEGSGETVRSETTIPSIFSSPWIRGARQSGFAVAMSRMRRRISAATGGLPRPTVFRCEIRAQNLRKRSRCHRTTVSGCTTNRAVLHRRQTLDSVHQNRRSKAVSLGLTRFR